MVFIGPPGAPMRALGDKIGSTIIAQVRISHTHTYNIYVCMRVYMFICVCACVCKCMYVCMCVYVHGMYGQGPWWSYMCKTRLDRRVPAAVVGLFGAGDRTVFIININNENKNKNKKIPTDPQTPTPTHPQTNSRRACP